MMCTIIRKAYCWNRICRNLNEGKMEIVFGKFSKYVSVRLYVCLLEWTKRLIFFCWSDAYDDTQLDMHWLRTA